MRYVNLSMIRAGQRTRQYRLPSGATIRDALLSAGIGRDLEAFDLRLDGKKVGPDTRIDADGKLVVGVRMVGHAPDRFEHVMDSVLQDYSDAWHRLAKL